MLSFNLLVKVTCSNVQEKFYLPVQYTILPDPPKDVKCSALSLPFTAERSDSRKSGEKNNIKITLLTARVILHADDRMKRPYA